MRQSVVSMFRNNAISTAALVGALLISSSGCNHGQEESQTPASYSSQEQYRSSQPQSYSQSSSDMYRRQQPSGSQYGAQSGSQYTSPGSSSQYGAGSQPGSQSGSQSSWQQYGGGSGSTYGSSSRIPESSQPSRGQEGSMEQGEGSQSFSQSGRESDQLGSGQQQGGESESFSTSGEGSQSGLTAQKAHANLHGVGGNQGSGKIEFSQAGNKAVKINADIEGLERGSYNVVVASSALCPTGTSQSEMGGSQSESGSSMEEGSQSGSQSGRQGSEGSMSGSRSGQMGGESGSSMSSQSEQSEQSGQSSQMRERTRLGQIRVGQDGTAQREWTSSQASLSGPNSVLGRSVLIVSRTGQEQGAGQQQSSQGQTLACGVIQAQGF